ncbi:uncharacterized protein [Physcomitrium patens]|uniref:Uncharacterized protein n=1 Tax=Physcomitrium patens TaxID=3218 RepID=A0A7I4EEF9_PHYPA
MRCSNPFSASVHRRSLPLTALRMHLPSEEDRILNFLGNEHRLNYEKQAYGGVCSVRNFGRPQTVCGLNGFWGSTHSDILRLNSVSYVVSIPASAILRGGELFSRTLRCELVVATSQVKRI